MRFLRQSLTGLFLLAATLGLLVYAAATVRDAVQTRMSEEPRVPQARERVFTVNVVTATAGREVPVLTAFGQVESRRELELRASAGGRIVELADGFVEGGHVEDQQLLARIDPADAEAALERAQSDLYDAEAEAREAADAVVLAQDNLTAAQEQAQLYEKAFQRQTDLQNRGVGTAAAVETAELQASSARVTVIQRRQSLAEAKARVDQSATTVQRAKLAVSEAERSLADTEIRAGFSGTLSDVTVVEGRLVSSNEQIASLVDPDALEVAFRVSTQAYARLLDDNGQLLKADVTVTLDVFGTDIEAQARIDRVAASTGDGHTGRVVYARMDRAPSFRPGDFVTVSVQEPALDNVVRLPATAVDGNDTVLVIGEEERLISASVQVMRRQGDDVLVRAPELEGKQIVAQRTPLLGDGIKVRTLAPAGENATAEPTLLELTEERRARLVAFVEGNGRMPEEAKKRVLAQLSQPKVPAEVVERIEARIGG